eukprot:CAMPEP_0113619934 /NCGR_PEP_ID=MMETSP0017_2-20120614/10140_1 /TAXON_ID=2856 /ORGANISM="Cylindrotheca closterium" /LENGTH=240 /DNA_ID=CAMNT_0000529553 /DNA_START=284 /DNA_END=1007 /DNA_ORIENTATION=+ /assembly_acc=CAM_ASM_000147
MVHEDADGENYQFRGGYGNHCNTTVKIQRCLKGQDMSSFVNLLEKKARYPHMWQPSDQSALDTFENKLLSSTKEDRDKVAEEHAYQREEDCITGQRVREKSSGRLGLCVAPVMGVSWPITFDDGEWPPIVTLARDEVDVLCKVCSKAATQRCLGAKLPGIVVENVKAKTGKSTRRNVKKLLLIPHRPLLKTTTNMPVHCVKQKQRAPALAVKKFGIVEGSASVSTGKNTSRNAKRAKTNE